MTTNQTQETTSQTAESSHAQLALIGLYMAADNRLTKLMGKVMRMLRRASTPLDLSMAFDVMRRGERQVVNQLERQTPPLLETLTRTVEQEMQVEARHLPPKPPTPTVNIPGNSPQPFDFTMPLGQRATSAIRVDLQTELKDIRARILRQHDDLYKLTASGAATHNMLRYGTIKDAQQSMMSDLLQHGVTGFTDRSGRNWQLSSYVEMAVRTASMRAYNEAHMQVMQAAGVTLFMVPVHAHTCPVCFKWQGKILSLTSDDDADATVDEARAAGLWHPNCEHMLVSFREGDKRPKVSEWTDRDQQLWESSQRQRSLESSIRAQKRVLVNSGDGQMRVNARAKIRRYQSQLRELTKSTGLLRRTRREQLDLGLRK
ncbi:phage minor capsid protein [Bifidobacterium aquikefiri]|uniref:phage minor capsid protein n=1 Tax=Bifidobacterium aquikefiri TaxID=1653207 RepID=UPI0039E7CF87